MKRLSAIIILTALLAPRAFAFGQNKIVYDKFNWNIYHSTHFDVYFYDEEKPSLQKVVDNAESAYDDLSRKFNFQISKKIPLIFYATHSAFEQTNVDLNFIPEGVGAFAEPARNRMVIPIDTTDEKLLQLITHELTHIFEYEILFQGKLGKTVTANPPTWLMEGLASFMAGDEDSKDRMVLRDAVVNDQVPPITRNPRGYFAYRFGHAVFSYMQQKYGWEGLRDFIYEYRNTLGSSVDKALKRAFDVTPDEFDSRFRTWLRKQYLPALIAKGEPLEYGDPFRINTDYPSDELSPVPSPSGDLLAGFTTYKEDIDVVLFNIPERKLLKNLTAGYTNRYEYAIAQSFTVGPVMGRDIGFAPNGDQVAIFVKKERGRNLLLINPVTGDTVKSIPMKVEQQLSPVYTRDGKAIAFSGFLGNQPDIFLYNLESGDLTNLTNDKFFDAAPVFSPDGKWMVYSSVVDGYAKLFRLNVANPTERYQLTSGKWNDADAYFSPDGKRIFFASDKQTGRNIEVAANILEKAEDAAKREGDTPKANPELYAAYNIYSLNLETGDVLQYTDVVGGCFTPVVFTSTNGKERMVFASYYKRRWQLFSAPTDKPLHEAEKTTLPSAPLLASERTAFQPPVEVAIDEEKIERPRDFRLFIDDVQVNAGVSSDQLFVSRSVIFMSDMLGNRRFIASLDSVSSFSNFDFLYFDLHRRLNWGVRLFDNRSFFTTPNFETGRNDRVQQLYRETGAVGILSYPFTRYHRVDFGFGYQSRTIAFPIFQPQPDGSSTLAFIERRDSFPIASASFSGDSTIFKSFGPISGRRYEVGVAYAPDTKNGGTLTSDYTAEFRQYLQLSSRTLLAARVFGGYSDGNFPNFYYFGGLNTLRGYDFRSLVGNRAAFANFEFRFPLVDVLATPVLTLQQVRGALFFDVGAANFEGQPFKFVQDGKLVDGKASVGYAVSFDFLGLELHWDFAKRFNGKQTEGKYRTSFWIGETF
ncbi:MAG: PD40 domain-containing protein [Acidobacteria bacterium]|nr:PD40 domain-containing protein [Acidobacteriota bacterium]